MLMYWMHAYMCDVKNEAVNGYEPAYLSYAFAKVQWDFDSSGPFHSRAMVQDAVKMGRTFLLLYQNMCVENAQHRR